MSTLRKPLPKTLLPALLGAVVIGAAAARIHVRVQTTLVGYEIGHLKNAESKLLEERATLRMQLAKLTTQKHLQLMTETGEHKTASEGTYALK